MKIYEGRRGVLGFRAERDNAEDHPFWYKVMVKFEDDDTVIILDSFMPRFGDGPNVSISEMNDDETLDALALATEVGDWFEQQGWIVRR